MTPTYFDMTYALTSLIKIICLDQLDYVGYQHECPFEIYNDNTVEISSAPHNFIVLVAEYDMYQLTHFEHLSSNVSVVDINRVNCICPLKGHGDYGH